MNRDKFSIGQLVMINTSARVYDSRGIYLDNIEPGQKAIIDFVGDTYLRLIVPELAPTTIRVMMYEVDVL